MQRYLVCQLEDLAPTPCPCGTTRRGFADDEDALGTVHLLEVRGAAQTHYHKRLTETYVVLEGTGHVELDGQAVPVRPYTAVMIRPGCRHRAVGAMKILIFVVPKFDPEDEWFDEKQDPEQ